LFAKYPAATFNLIETGGNKIPNVNEDIFFVFGKTIKP